MQLPDVPPLFSGTLNVRCRVIIRDPHGRSRIGGVGTLAMVDYVAGAPWWMHVDLGSGRTAHVAPDWVHDVPTGPNIIPFWSPDLFEIVAGEDLNR